MLLLFTWRNRALQPRRIIVFCIRSLPSSVQPYRAGSSDHARRLRIEDARMILSALQQGNEGRLRHPLRLSYLTSTHDHGRTCLANILGQITASLLSTCYGVFYGSSPASWYRGPDSTYGAASMLRLQPPDAFLLMRAGCLRPNMLTVINDDRCLLREVPRLVDLTELASVHTVTTMR